MQKNIKKVVSSVSVILTLLMFALTSAYAVQSKKPTQASAKKTQQEDVFEAQAYYLGGVDNLAMEFRYQNKKLVSMFFWNKSDKSVMVDALNQEFIVPGEGHHQLFTVGADKILVTVKPYDPIMSARLKKSFPGKHYLFVKSQEGIGYDMYSIPGNDKWLKEARAIDKKNREQQKQVNSTKKSS